MRNITPHLWFDREAKEAAEFYVSTFPDSRITSVSTVHDTPSGDCDIVAFELFGRPFQAISAGPDFKFNPSISFLIACRTKEEVEGLWETLTEGGEALVPLGSYPFSDLFGWTNDRFGLSWQVMYVGEQEIGERLTPTLMFVGEVRGKAEEAVNLYTSIFDDSSIGPINRYGPGEEPDREGTVKHVVFSLEGNHFAAMDSAQPHKFSFNEAVSLMVECRTQREIDRYFDSLSAVPEVEQCGWLKDKFGVSWQVVPVQLGEMLDNGSREQIDRVTRAFLQMKKYSLAELEKAYQGS